MLWLQQSGGVCLRHGRGGCCQGWRCTALLQHAHMAPRVRPQAAANAKHNRGALKTKLVVTECFADKGPYIKRFRPRAKGRWVPRGGGEVSWGQSP